MRNDVKKGLSREVLIALVVVGLLAFALLGYFALVRPQRAEAAQLEQEIAQTRQQITARRAAVAAASGARLSPAVLRRLATALPDRVEMPRLVRELNRTAGQAGVTFESITPQTPVGLRGYQAVPISLIVQGRFFDVRDFLHLLRERAAIRGGKIAGRGRLFAVESVDFAEGEDGFPQLRTNVTLNVFTFAGAAAAATGSAAAPDAATTTNAGGTP